MTILTMALKSRIINISLTLHPWSRSVSPSLGHRGERCSERNA